MKLSHLRDFVAVAEAGSLRKAGRRLGIAQPVITRSIHEIEHELGASLFQRHSRGVWLTEMGEAFLRRATLVQAELRRAREDIDQMRGMSTGQVSVALSIAAGIALMPSVFGAFEKRYPDALLQISESLFDPIEADIASGKLDFFVGPWHETTTPAHLAVEKLFDNRRVILARKGHPLLGKRKLAELTGARWVRPSFAARRTMADFEAVFQRASLPPPRVALNSGSALMTLLAVSNSDLLTILPVQWLEFPTTADRVEAIEIDEPLLSTSVWIVRRADVPLTPMAQHLCDLMRKAGNNYEPPKSDI